MSGFLVRKSSLQGKLAIPTSKSHTLRAILFASLAKGKSVIFEPLTSPDAKAMIEACQALGASFTFFPHKLEIEGINGEFSEIRESEKSRVIDVGNSGLVLRLISAISALSSQVSIITGDHSICHQRPMKPLLDALLELGVKTKSLRGNDYAPLSIQGPILGNVTQVNGEDSQPVSSLIIAAAIAPHPIEIFVTNPGEKPWVSLTLHWLDRLKIPYKNNNFKHFVMQGGAKFSGFNYHVPGDLSTLAFPVAAALVTNSELLIENVDLSDVQGDKAFIFLLQKMGADISINSINKTLQVKETKILTGVEVDINGFIDAIPILAVVACFAEGKTCIKNAHVARHKECNRLQSIVCELRKMGANIEETEEGLTVQKSTLVGASLNSYGDHRMAMALSIAGLGAEGETSISPVDCIAKTYLNFFQSFKSLGANIEVWE